jgi:histidinol-phosphate aminotransferase
MVPPHLRGVEPYVPSVPDDELKRLYGCEKLHRLNNNENALGPCPAALRALADFESGDVKTYPSGDCFHLREAIASRFSLDPGHVVVGNGANEVISFAIRGFCEKGDKVVLPDRTFAVCEWQAQHCGCDIALIPLSGSFNDLDALRDAIDSRTKLVYVCNPNNPTGGFHGRAALKSFLEGVAGRAVVVIDEAYIEFVENYEAESCVPLLSEHPNLLLFRTFSKAFALAGLRIGYALCSEELSEALRRVRTVYSVNSYSQVAALACVEPSAETDEHLAKTRRMVAESKAILTSRFDALGLRHMEGEGNFVMAELPFDDALAYRMLMRQGYMVRTMTGFRFPNWIRVTCVQPQVMEGFCEALTGILESRRRK